MAAVGYKLSLAIIYLACTDATHFGSRAGGVTLIRRQRQRAIRFIASDDAILAIKLRGGGDGIEQNPDYDEPDDIITNNDNSSDDDDSESEVEDVKVISRPKRRHSKSSKSRKSMNKRVLKLLKRNQLNLYILFAIIAFRWDTHAVY